MPIILHGWRFLDYARNDKGKRLLVQERELVQAIVTDTSDYGKVVGEEPGSGESDMVNVGLAAEVVDQAHERIIAASGQAAGVHVVVPAGD